MNYEIQLVNAVIDYDDFSGALDQGIESLFIECKDIWAYVVEFYNKYGTLPSKQTVKSHFGEFEFAKTEEPLNYYIDNAREENLDRFVRSSIKKGIELLKENGPNTALDYLAQESHRLLHFSGKVKDVDIASDFEHRIASLRDRLDGKNDGNLGIPSGIKPIDANFGGWQPGDFVVLAGWSGSGKSSLALLFAIQAWLNGYKPLIISLEMDRIQVEYRVDTILNRGEFFKNSELIHARDIDINQYEKWVRNTFDGKHPFHLVTSDGIDQPNQNMVQAKIRQYNCDLCHEKGTEILTEDKWILVEEHPSARERISDGYRVRLNGLRPLEEVVTPEHLYWCRRVVAGGTEWEYRKRHNLPYSNLRRVAYEGWVEAKELTNRHYIGYPIDASVDDLHPIHYKRGNHMAIPDEFYDEEWWWAFGYWWGDGNINQEYIEFSVNNNDVDILQRLINLGQKYGRSPSIKQLAGCKKVKIAHSVLARWLKSWRVGNSMKKPPHWVEKIDTKFQKKLIQGYIDADGNKYKSGYQLSSIYLDGLLCARRILARLGKASYVYHGNKHGHDRIFPNGKVGHCKKSYNLMIPSDEHEKNGQRLRGCYIEDGYLWSKVCDKEYVSSSVFVPINTKDTVYNTHYGMSHNCIVDYHGLLEDAKGGGTTTEKTKNISTSLKRIAASSRVPVIDIVSVTMEDGWEERPPELHEMAWSKQIAYDADLVLALHRPKDGGLFQVAARKVRRGPLFAFYLQWDIDSGIWEEYHD